ncbi:MAG: AmmeMemoRadiSam system protein B [Gemmatimonadota bacterium]|nr:MAG: AmmeMemoRadiSam system protein B [Gemmatimonadota bacterium]
MGETRRPAVAGMFYPADPAELRSLVQEMLGEVDAEPQPAQGAIAPHAGLVYSGRCAAQVWGRLVIPEIVVIIAPNHTGMLENPSGASAWNEGSFETPLGAVPIAHDFLERVEAHCPLLRHDPAAHLREHAIEVELPFLRLLAPDALLAPIVLAWDRWEPSRELGAALAAAAREWPGDVLLVASSDMTHYESADRAARKDRQALAAVERLDGEELLAVCHREGVTMCGRAPSATVLEAARQLGAQQGEVVDYRHSGWVTGDDREVVAYAGVVLN